MRNVRSFAGVFDGDPADVARGIEIKQGVFVQVFGLADSDRPEFDVKRVGVLEVADFHGLNKKRCERSPCPNRETAVRRTIGLNGQGI